jgi:hypothetical protein
MAASHAGYAAESGGMNDVCCWACRSPTGVCLSRYACQHHKEAEALDEASHRARRTHRTPTEDQAIANVMRERRRKE